MSAFLLTITLTIQGPNWTLDINPNITFEANIMGKCGTSFLPHVTTIYPPNCGGRELNNVIRHEWKHHDQWSVLGPAFPIAYGLTGGRAFEYYEDMEWTPPGGMQDQCPLFRIRNEGVEFMPCYRL